MVTGTQECEQSNTDCRQAGGGQHRVMTALEIGNRTFEIESRRRAQQAVDHALPVAGLVPALKRGEVRVQDGGGVINGGVDHAMVRPARAAGGHRNGRLTGFCFLFFHAEIPGAVSKRRDGNSSPVGPGQHRPMLRGDSRARPARGKWPTLFGSR